MDSLALLFRKKKKNKAATTTAERAEGQSFSLRIGGAGGGVSLHSNLTSFVTLTHFPHPLAPGAMLKICATMIQIWTRAKPYLLFLEICRILKSKQRGCRDKKVETPEKRSRRDLVASAQKTSNLPARPLKKKNEKPKDSTGFGLVFSRSQKNNKSWMT